MKRGGGGGSSQFTDLEPLALQGHVGLGDLHLGALDGVLKAVHAVLDVKHLAEVALPQQLELPKQLPVTLQIYCDCD